MVKPWIIMLANTLQTVIRGQVTLGRERKTKSRTMYPQQ